MVAPLFSPLNTFREFSAEEMKIRARSFRDEMVRRRTVRQFSNRPVARGVIDDCLRTAGSAPSGANLQPWQFVVVTDAEIKRQIRDAAEEEERIFYHQRAPEEWLEALAPLGTDEHKPYIEIAPYLIAVFAQTYGVTTGGKKVKNYYVYGVGRHRYWNVDCCRSLGWASFANAHPQPHGLPQFDLR